jgi:hypothetical protein
MLLVKGIYQKSTCYLPLSSEDVLPWVRVRSRRHPAKFGAWGEIACASPFPFKCAVYKALISVSFRTGILWCCFSIDQGHSHPLARLVFFLCCIFAGVWLSRLAKHTLGMLSRSLCPRTPHRRLGDESLRGRKASGIITSLLISTSPCCITHSLLLL